MKAPISSKEDLQIKNEEPGFDQTLEQLKQIVSKLEQGNLSLEQALIAFEQGVALSKRGTEILEQAEKRIDVLMKGEDGTVKVQPYKVP